MSAESLSLIAGTVLSLSLTYVPGVNNWYSRYDPTQKRLIMLALLAISASAVYALACLGWGAAWRIAVTCDEPGLFGLIEQLVLAIIANQSIYIISPRIDREPADQDRKLSY